jgi:NADH dehydrogenase FAD-containing subunit
MSSKSRLAAISDHLAPSTSSEIVAVEGGAEIGASDGNSSQTRTIFPPLELEDHPLDEYRRLRVIVVGAGISGISSAILLPAKVPNLDLVIYERNSDVVRSFTEIEIDQIY